MTQCQCENEGQVGLLCLPLVLFHYVMSSFMFVFNSSLLKLLSARHAFGATLENDKLLKPGHVLMDVDMKCSRDKTTLGINDVNLSDSDTKRFGSNRFDQRDLYFYLPFILMLPIYIMRKTARTVATCLSIHQPSIDKQNRIKNVQSSLVVEAQHKVLGTVHAF